MPIATLSGRDKNQMLYHYAKYHHSTPFLCIMLFLARYKDPINYGIAVHQSPNAWTSYLARPVYGLVINITIVTHCGTWLQIIEYQFYSRWYSLSRMKYVYVYKPSRFNYQKTRLCVFDFILNKANRKKFQKIKLTNFIFLHGLIMKFGVTVKNQSQMSSRKLFLKTWL